MELKPIEQQLVDAGYWRINTGGKQDDPRVEGTMKWNDLIHVLVTNNTSTDGKTKTHVLVTMEQILTAIQDLN